MASRGEVLPAGRGFKVRGALVGPPPLVTGCPDRMSPAYWTGKAHTLLAAVSPQAVFHHAEQQHTVAPLWPAEAAALVLDALEGEGPGCMSLTFVFPALPGSERELQRATSCTPAHHQPAMPAHLPRTLPQCTSALPPACPWTPPVCAATPACRRWHALRGEHREVLICKGFETAYVRADAAACGEDCHALFCDGMQGTLTLLPPLPPCLRRSAGLQISLGAAPGGMWQSMALPELVQQLNACAAVVPAHIGEGQDSCGCSDEGHSSAVPSPARRPLIF